MSKHLLRYNNSVKRRLNEIDSTIDDLSQRIVKISHGDYKSELYYKINTARFKKEKIQAMAAVAKSQNLLAEVELLIAENELRMDVERLSSKKKIKLDLCHIENEGYRDSPKIRSHKSSRTECRLSETAKTKRSNEKLHGIEKATSSSKESDISTTDSVKKGKTNLEFSTLIDKEKENCLTKSMSQIKNKESAVKKSVNNLGSTETCKIINSNINIFKNKLKEDDLEQTSKSKNKFTVCDVKVTSKNFAKHDLPPVIIQPRYNLVNRLSKYNGSDEIKEEQNKTVCELKGQEENDINILFRELMTAKNQKSYKKENIHDVSMNSTLILEELSS